MPRHFAHASLALFLIAGCSQSNPKDQPKPAPVAGAATPLPEAPPGSADAIARQTQTYAERMEALLAMRDNPRNPAATASPTPQATPTTRPIPTTWPSAKIEAWDNLDPSHSPAAVAPLPEHVRPETLTNQLSLIAPPNDHAAATRPPFPREHAPTPTGDGLEAKIIRQSHDQPRDLAAQLDYQLLSLLRDEAAPQSEPLAALPAEDRETLNALLDAISNFRNAIRTDPNLLSSVKLRPLLELSDRLHGQSDLRIPTLTLCTRVDGFGNYEPIEPLRFAAGKDHQAIVYCEVENFASQLNDKHLWETKLTQEVVLWTENGDPVWKDKNRPILDLARNRRRDFYLIRKITLPTTLGVNRYLLKVTIVDSQANRVAESTVPITIVAD